MIAMKKHTDEEMLFFSCRQLQQSEQLKPLLSLYTQDTVQKGDSRDYTRLEEMLARYSEQKIPVQNISPHEGQLGKPESGVAAAKGKNQGTGKRNSGGLRAMHNKKFTALQEISVE